jgi:hypothetical protein
MDCQHLFSMTAFSLLRETKDAIPLARCASVPSKKAPAATCKRQAFLTGSVRFSFYSAARRTRNAILRHDLSKILREQPARDALASIATQMIRALMADPS